MIETIARAPLITKLCAAALILFVAVFVCRFVPLAIGRWRALNRVIKGLSNLKATGGDPTPIFSGQKDLAHLWSEFRKTLFEQKSFDSARGAYVVNALRLTVPAEQFFNPQVVVDSRVGAEFFKHLPGILTGIGIIGTFFGILHGLAEFTITDNAQVVRSSLSALLHSVSEAFLVSAFAILCAMLITVVEKLFISSLYRKTEEVAFLLDGMYKTGAGEEMLSQLVNSTDEYVSNSKTLKDALVQDLKGILTSLTDSQIEAQQRFLSEQIKAQSQSSEELGRQIGQHITEGLRSALEEPMKAMSETLQSASGDRTSAVHTLLTDVVQGLNQSLKDLFGDQIAGINTMQQQTISALQTAVVRMEQMSSSLETAGTRATDTMATRLGEVITSMEARQEMMTRQMAQIVEDMKASVAHSQTETNGRLQETLARVGQTIETLVTNLSQSVATSQSESNNRLQETLSSVGQTVETLVAGLSQQAATATTSHAERQSQLAAQAEASVSGVQGAVETLTAEVKALVSETRTTVDAMRSVTTDAVSRMNSGAETMYVASSEFGKAGTAVTSAMQQAASTSDKLAEAASSVGTAMQSMQGVVNDYRATRDQLGNMLAELAKVVENARTDASITSDVLSRIEASTRSLNTAQLSAQEFLEGVADVLGDSLTQFQQRLADSMTEVNRELVNKTSAVTSLLGQTIQELAQAVELVVPNPGA